MNLKGGSIRYWHDTGHAEVQDKLGLTSHAELLNSYSGYMAGVHIHDVKDLTDHLAPGEGDFDFSALKKHLKPSTVKVLELDFERSEKDKLAGGIEFTRRELAA